jgi:O-antigen/teichoic acid export membrane protein
MSLAKKIAHNTLIQIAGKIISTVLGLFSLALITRYLGQTGFGEYTTVMTFLTFFAVIADLGLTLITVQMISGQKNDEGKILNNLFSLRLVSALFFLGLAPIMVIFFPYSAAVKAGVLLAAISFVFPALNQVLVGLFQKKLNMDRSALAEVASRLVLIFGILLTKSLHAGLTGILITTIASLCFPGP